MKLFLVLPNPDLHGARYDAYSGHVIRAEGPRMALLMAAARAADEGQECWRRGTATELTLDGPRRDHPFRLQRRLMGGIQ